MTSSRSYCVKHGKETTTEPCMECRKDMADKLKSEYLRGFRDALEMAAKVARKWADEQEIKCGDADHWPDLNPDESIRAIEPGEGKE